MIAGLALASVGQAAASNDINEMFWDNIGGMMQRLGEKAEEYRNAKEAVFAMDKKYTAIYNECQKRQQTCEDACKDYSKVVFNYKYWARARNLYVSSDRILQTAMGMRSDPLGQTMNIRNLSSIGPDFYRPFYGTPEACERPELAYRKCLDNRAQACEDLWQTYDQCMKVETVKEAKYRYEAHLPAGDGRTEYYIDASNVYHRLVDMEKRHKTPANAEYVREKIKELDDKYGNIVLHCVYTKNKPGQAGHKFENIYYFWLDENLGKAEDMEWYQAIPLEYRDAYPIEYYANIELGSPRKKCPAFNDEAARLKKMDASTLLAKQCPEVTETASVVSQVGDSGTPTATGHSTAGGKLGGTTGSGDFLLVLITAALGILAGVTAAESRMRSWHTKLASVLDILSPQARSIGMVALIWGVLMLLWSIVSWSFLANLLPYVALILCGIAMAGSVITDVLVSRQAAKATENPAQPVFMNRLQTMVEANKVLLGLLCSVLAVVHLLAGHFFTLI